MFSCEYYKIFKNSFFIEHLRWLLFEFIYTEANLGACPPLMAKRFAKIFNDFSVINYLRQ